jgi:hypothetical protein
LRGDSDEFHRPFIGPDNNIFCVVGRHLDGGG